MWNTILLNIVLSIIIIFASHQIWEYCKSNYTTHKIKNTADTQASKYKSMLEDMERAHSLQQSTEKSILSKRTSQTREVDAPRPEIIEHSPTPRFISMEEKEWIQTELTKFIQDI
jgi:hypothetical protein